LRLVSYNIAHARGWMPHQGLVPLGQIQRNLDRIAALIRSMEPDLVALQEIDAGSVWNGSFDHVTYLRERTGLGFAAFGASNDFSGAAGKLRLCYGNAVLSRHPIALAEAHRFGTRKLGAKGLLYTEVLWRGALLPVVSLHLHHASRSQRCRQASDLLNLLVRRSDGLSGGGMPRLPVLIAGDFNCPAHAVGDAADLLLRGTESLRGYWHAPVRARTFPSLRPTRMLDYWLLPPGWVLRSCHAHRTRASDHLPVIVEVEVPAIMPA
jgi:endonuclease/exonuclease/phosphatase family metal-dependent hydrolase